MGGGLSLWRPAKGTAFPVGTVFTECRQQDRAQVNISTLHLNAPFV